MDRQDEKRQDAERLMRRAAELGHDPERVALALNHHPPGPVELQQTVEVRQRSWFGARLTHRLARRPPRR